MNANTLSFHNTHFEVVDRDNQPWLRLLQIGGALGYSKPDLLGRIYKKHADEFTDQMTALVDLPTGGGIQQTRIFSLRGAHLLAMFARTKVAKEFRKWVLDVLDQEVERGRAVNPTKALSGGLTPDQCDAIKALVRARAENIPREKQAKAVITCWSALKSKFGVTYKKIAPEHYEEALSLVARVDLEGEYLPAGESEDSPKAPEPPQLRVLGFGLDQGREYMVCISPSGMASNIYSDAYWVVMPLLPAEIREKVEAKMLRRQRRRRCQPRRPSQPKRSPNS